MQNTHHNIRVGINGFGRIGRAVMRACMHPQNQDVQVVHINNLAPCSVAAHLLTYDSIHGKQNMVVEAEGDEALVLLDKSTEKKVRYSRFRDPRMISWTSEVDVVFECSGAFNSYEQALYHGCGGVSRVLVSAPCKGAPLTVVYGVNDGDITGREDVISNASCTTNCLAVVAKLLSKHIGVEYASMSTIHAYTSDQRLLDAPHKDLRRARAANLSMIPTTTGAAKMVGEVVPELAGKVHGMAIRVPTANVSLTDAVFTLSQDADIPRIHDILETASQGFLKGILGMSHKPLVSCDFNGSSYSATVDTEFSTMIGKRMCKLLLWYDNETGFSWRMLDVARKWMRAASQSNRSR